MILPRHPDLMSDPELGEWVHRLVTQKEPESIFLDYKETIATNSRSDKREIAKDVSSFANERGGVVLYGIPEERENDEPVPVDVNDIGMEPVSGLPHVIEDILVGALTPRLPELRVREVPLVNSPNEVVYLVWHPESWEAPHMIHAYGEHRYYKRGNFRAVLMEEGEVERLYLRRQTRRALAAQFFAEADFGEWVLPQGESLMRIVVCPAIPFESRIDFSDETMREWLKSNTPDGRYGWEPFIEGVRHVDSPIPPRRTGLVESRLFCNGAASVCTDYFETGEEKTVSGLRFLCRLDGFLRLVGSLYGQINMSGDILVDIKLFNMDGVALDFGVSVSLSEYGIGYRWHGTKLQFRVAASAMDVLTDNGRWALERRIMDRLTQCFGAWSIPVYFREDGSPNLAAD
jgi:hypothetical protein